MGNETLPLASDRKKLTRTSFLGRGALLLCQTLRLLRKALEWRRGHPSQHDCSRGRVRPKPQNRPSRLYFASLHIGSVYSYEKVCLCPSSYGVMCALGPPHDKRWPWVTSFSPRASVGMSTQMTHKPSTPTLLPALTHSCTQLPKSRAFVDPPQAP